jgi:hypothetical protein
MPLASAAPAAITTTAAAPSLIPEELPAVTEPSLRKKGLSLARSAMVRSARGCSSVSNGTVSFFRLTSTGTICSRKWPSVIARAAR